MTRRVPVLLAVVSAGLAGCQPRLSLKTPVQVGTTKAPIIGMVFVPAEYLALQPKLEELFDGPVLFNPGLSPNDIAAHLNNGDWQLAILSATEYVGLSDPSGLHPIAAAIGENGSTLHKGLLIADAKSDVKTIAGCKGKRFAFGKAHDLLYDYAARAALRSAGVPEGDLARELLPPHVLSGRLHLNSGDDVAKVVAFDPTVPAGVIDEVTYLKLPDSGGNLITGPSKDMFVIIGDTQSVPGEVVLASNKADPAMVEKLRAFLTLRVKDNPDICKQMHVRGFADVDAAAYAAAAQLAPRT